MSWTIGVDVGGTFTDFYGLDEAGGAVWLHKRASTPVDPGRAIVEGIETFLASTARRGCAAPRPWHHGRHQRADPAPGRPGRAPHDARLSRPARDRPPDPAAHVRPLCRLPAALGAARAPFRAQRAHPGRRLGASPDRCRGAGRGGRGGARVRRRGLRGLLPVRLPQPGARAGGRGCPAVSAPRAASLALVRGAAGVPRVRALLDHRAERLSAAGDGALPGAARGRARRAAPRGRGRHQPVERRADVARPRPRSADPHRALRSRGRRRRRGRDRRDRRPAGRHHPRHGRHQRRRRPDPGRPRGARLRPPGRRLPDPPADGRHPHRRARAAARSPGSTGTGSSRSARRAPAPCRARPATAGAASSRP